MAKKILCGASVLFALAALAIFISPTESWAGVKPCCVGGTHPGKFCSDENDCPDACVGGSDEGRDCASNGCPGACIGGSDPGKRCNIPGDCVGICSGGTSPGASCNTDPPCGEGGTCTDAGNCGPPGVCTNIGTCTGQCLSKGKGPKASPTDPVAVADDESEDVTVSSNEGSVPETKPCP